MKIKKLVTVLLFLIVPVLTSTFATGESEIYIKKDTWQQTIRRSREALIRRERAGITTAKIPDLASSDFSICLWIKTKQDSGAIFTKSPEEEDAASQPKILYLQKGAPAYKITSVGTLKCSTTINDGQWHHIALLGNNPLQFFIDGKPAANGSIGTAQVLTPESSEYSIIVGNGSEIDEQVGNFNGSLDEMRVYDRKLSAKDIKTLLTNPSEVKEKLAVWWQFEGNRRIEDASGNGYNARIFGTERTEGKIGNAAQFPGEGAMWFSTRRMRQRDPRSQLWGRINQDFTDEQSIKQIRWEREDKIWSQDWEPGSIRQLAERYAHAIRDIGDLPMKAKKLAKNAKTPDDLDNLRKIYYLSVFNQNAYDQLNSKIGNLRSAVSYLRKQFGDDYLSGSDYLKQLDLLEKHIAPLKQKPIDRTSLDRIKETFKKLQYQALVAGNPLFNFEKLLFVKRYTYQSSHYYTDFIDGCDDFGGNINILSLKDGTVKKIIPSMQKGIFGRYDLSFDAEKIVFDWKEKHETGFRLYEIGIDGKDLRQLTFEPPDEQKRIEKYDNSFLGGTGENYNHHTDDMHPCYLPDGGIMFSSSRCEYGTLCDGPDILSTAILYRIDGDGSNMQQLTNSAVSEFSPIMMPDGRIIYSRWEYVDKGQIGVKCLWAMRPDGSGSVEIFANDIALPPVFIHPRPIPGYRNEFSVLGTPHFPQSGVGTVIRLDINKPVRTRDPMTYITPTVDIRTEGGFHHKVNDRWVKNSSGPLYMDPYPLNEKFYLVSHNPDKLWNDEKAWGLYLLDEFGNHVLIYKDAQFSCWQPMPLRPAEKPPVIPSVLNKNQKDEKMATVVLSDVYVGLPGVKRGTIKYLRIMEQVSRPWDSRRFWDQQGRYGYHGLLSTGSVLGLKVLHGIVPVYEDGSAYFKVPTDKNIYFEAMDENFLEIQRQRTYVNYRPGETRTCIGCHEFRRLAPANKKIIALNHPPSKPEPQPGETAPRAIHYPKDVQPVLDKYCIECHSGQKAAANLVLTGELTTQFNQSYENIMRRDLVVTTDEGSDFEGTELIPPRTLGSSASRLVKTLTKEHHGLKLPKEALIKITTWIDANAQYYGTYYGRKNIRYKDHPNFRPVPTFAEAVSTKTPLEKENR